MATNMWDEWLRGGAAPLNQVRNLPTTGYSALTGEQAPRTPTAYRPQLGSNSSHGANGPGLGRLSNFTPDAWYKGVPGISFGDFISEDNADWFRREWTQSKGLGQQTEQALGRFSPIPQYWLAALGKDKQFALNQPNAPQRQADLMGKLYERLLGPNDGYIDPQGIMQKVIGSTWNSKKTANNDYLANMVANPALSPDAQVGNFWNFVNGTVGRLMPQGSMQAYQKIVERESNLYQDFMRKNPAVSLTFNRWIGQRLGPTGGL
jgi:hypothetical protein